MPQIQREGFRWKRLGIDTVERAEEYLRREELTDQREWKILSIIGVKEPRAAVERINRGELVKGRELVPVYHRLSQAERERLEREKKS